jgi:MFS family permease
VAPSREDFQRSVRSLRFSRLATAVVRLLNGFLLALLAFEFKESGGLLDFGALIAAAGVGFGLASFVSPWLARRLREEPMVVAALAVEAAAAFISGQFFSLWAAALLAGSAGLAWGTAKFGFDALLQGVVHPDRRGTAFTRAETLFQLAWVVGAVVPVAVSIPAEVGLVVAGVTALAAQTVFVSRLLIEPRSR